MLTNRKDVPLLSSESSSLSILNDVRGHIEKISQRELPEIDKKTALYMLRAGLIMISIFGESGYVNISLQLPAGYLFAFCNVFTFMVLGYDCGDTLIKSLLEVKTPEQERLKRRPLPLYLGVVTGIANAALACLSQIPGVFPALVYNDRKYGVPLVVAGFASSLWFPAASLQGQTELMFSRIGQNPKALDIQDRLIGILQENKSYFINLPLDQKAVFIRALQLAKSLDRSQDPVTGYLKAIVSVREPSAPAVLSPIQQVFLGSASGVGVFLTLGYQAGCAWYTEEITKEYITKDTTLLAIFCSAAIIATMFISKLYIADSARGFSKSLIDRVDGKVPDNLAEQLRKNQTITAKVTACFLCLMALGPIVVIWQDFFKGNRALQLTFTPVMCASYFLLLSTPELKIIESLIESKIIKEGSSIEKEMIETVYEYDNLISFIQKSSPETSEKFISLLPREVQDRFVIEARVGEDFHSAL